MKISEINKHLWEQVDHWTPHWRDIQELMLPYRGRLGEDSGTEGKERADERYDGTATRALRILSAGMHGGMTSASSKWFRLGFADKLLTSYGPVRQWLDIVEEIMYSALRRSNFYQAVQNIYLENGGFGTACLFEEAHSSGQGVWFRVFTIGDFTLAADVQGRVNTLFRRDWLTVQQMVGMFGLDNLSPATQSFYSHQPYKYIKIFQGIMPRENYDRHRIDANSLPFKSVYFEENTEDILREGGYSDFPAMCPRWDTIGSNVFGYSPGMDALPDVRSMNGITADLLTAVEKEVNPPVNVPESLGDDLDLLPGGRNPSTGNEKVEATYQIKPNLTAGAAIKAAYKQDIGDWFYTGLFILMAQPGATATEVATKNEEQLVQLGPVIQREFIELLNPVVKRTFNILNVQGLIPPPPEEIERMPFEIEYISVLAQAQKLVGLQKIERFTGFVGGVAQAAPSAMDKVDTDALVDEYASGTGVPARLLRGNVEIKEIRAIRQQELERKQQREEQQENAQTALTMANTKLDDSNLLTEGASG